MEKYQRKIPKNQFRKVKVTKVSKNLKDQRRKKRAKFPIFLEVIKKKIKVIKVKV